MWLNIVKYGGYAMFLKEVVDRVVEAKNFRLKIKRRNNARNLAIGATLGTALGAAVGILFAPKSGRETREEITKRTQETLEAMKSNVSQARERISESVKSQGQRWRQAAEKCADAAKEESEGHKETQEGSMQ
jgi:gas vesicle protein